MRLALVCTGPTANEFPGGYECTIGVKRAATAFLCDWVAILDSPTLAELCPMILGSPRLLTRAAYRPKFSTIPGIDVESLSGPDKFDHWTATAALVLAGNIGANRIDVYGADWTDAPNFDGSSAGDSDRGPLRWFREIKVWNEIVKRHAGNGIKVTRYGNPKLS